ncbi:hypothetical protein BHE74_00023878 [Ensete ventricosum]|nr:hypothetical protein BHE74_00023878 [Ensete ventricosum]
MRSTEALKVELPKQATVDYKQSTRFEMGLVQTGQVSYEYGYHVTLAQFQARYPELEVEEDPFKNLLEDLTVPMEVDQSFDDTLSPSEVALPGFPRIASCFADTCSSWELHSAMVGRGIPGGSMVVIGEWSPVTDIVSEVSLSNEVFDMIFKIMAFLYVMSILSMETVVSSFVTPFGVCFDGVRGL